LTTSYYPFESTQDADVERLSGSKCRLRIGRYQSQWMKPFGIDEAERTKLHEWLRSAIKTAKEGALVSSKFTTVPDEVADADDATLLQLSTSLGTSVQVRVLAVSNLALRGSRHLAEARGITNHILSASGRRLIKRAFRAATERDVDEIRRCVETKPASS
jgi:hypothetical protein